MNEVEKMYENAGFIQKRCKDYSCPVCEQYNDCEKYPPFTAEKQIELIKLIACNKINKSYRYISLDKDEIDSRWHISLTKETVDSATSYNGRNINFGEALAELINSLWQSLTDAERTQIKNILESEGKEMTSNRYVVLNCPTLMGNRLCYSKVIKQCADCADCVVKQIITICKWYKMSKEDMKRSKEHPDIIRGSEYGRDMLAIQILRLFDIEEINK